MNWCPSANSTPAFPGNLRGSPSAATGRLSAGRGASSFWQVRSSSSGSYSVTGGGEILLGGDHHAGVPDGRPTGALGPGDVEAADAGRIDGDCRRREEGHAEGRAGRDLFRRCRGLVERRGGGDLARLGEPVAAAEGAREHDGVGLAGVEPAHPAPGDVDVRLDRVDGEGRTFVRKAAGVAHLHGRAPGRAAVVGVPDHHVALGGRDDTQVGDVDGVADEGAGRAARRDDLAHRRVRPGNVHRDPGLVDEVVRTAQRDLLLVHVADGIGPHHGTERGVAVLLVVQVDEAGQEDLAVVALGGCRDGAAVEDDSAEVEHAVGSGPDHGVRCRGAGDGDGR